MSTKKFLFFIIILFLLLPSAVILSWPSAKAQFIACNVGQGDAILLRKGFTQILIDGGPNNQVLNCLKNNLPFYDRTIELMINTHPEKDHLAGLIEVLKRYQVKQLITDGVVIDTETDKTFNALIKEKHIPVFMAKKGDQINLNDLTFFVLWPPTNYINRNAAASQLIYSSEEKGSQVLGKTSNIAITKGKEGTTNNQSLVLLLTSQNSQTLLTGDIDELAEKQLIKDNQFDNIKILKVAHHGSKTSTSQEFLEAVKPQISIISVGKNSYGHPGKEVLDRLIKIGSQILRTDQNEVRISL